MVEVAPVHLARSVPGTVHWWLGSLTTGLCERLYDAKAFPARIPGATFQWLGIQHVLLHP